MGTKLMFGLESQPEYEGPNQDRVIPPDPDCCRKEECVPRDYARAVILTLERTAQAYAGLRLLAWNSSRLWHCEEPGGHTVGCTNPDCRFGSDMAQALDTLIERYATVVREMFATLVIPAADLDGWWQDFFDAEQAHVGLLAVGAALKNGEIGSAQAVGTSQVYVDLWRRMVTADDEDEYDRWFTPPDPDAPIPFRPRA